MREIPALVATHTNKLKLSTKEKDAVAAKAAGYLSRKKVGVCAPYRCSELSCSMYANTRRQVRRQKARYQRLSRSGVSAKPTSQSNV